MINIDFFQSEMDAVASGPDVPFGYDEALMTTSTQNVEKSLTSNVDENGSGLGKSKNGEERKADSSVGRSKKSEFKIREENDRIRRQILRRKKPLI